MRRIFIIEIIPMEDIQFQMENTFLGYNRLNSYDSRMLKNPFIKIEYIKGKAILKIYLFNNYY